MLFKEFDYDNNGIITAGEFYRAFKSIGSNSISTNDLSYLNFGKS